MNDRLDAAVAALAELLCRRCVEPQRFGDAESARRMLAVLVEEGVAPEILAVAVGGVWAAYRPDETLPHDADVAVLECARVLLRTEISEVERSLSTAALGLMAQRRSGNQAAVDLVNVAVSARRVEQHDVALWAARLALDRRDALSRSHETLALLTVAVITHDPETIEAAYAKAAVLPPDDLAARSAESLRPTLRADGSKGISQAGEAVRASDRPAAAAALAREFAELRAQTDDDLLRGLHEALTALSGADIEVDDARRGLTLAVGHLRRRQRFGQIPPVARSGIDIVADLLTLATSASGANLLTELVEALADAGLSELVELADDEVPAMAQAHLNGLAQRRAAWPDLRRCVDGLRGCPALMMRRQRMLSTGQFTVLGLYVVPPDSLAIKKTILSEAHSLAVEQLAAGDPLAISELDPAAVSDLIRTLLPASLVEHAQSGTLPRLVIVPDGPLWAVPWQASDLLHQTSVTVAPSLSVHSRLTASRDPIRRVTALLDDDAPGAQVVFEALQEARAEGRLDVRFTARPDDSDPADLLLVFGHGSGRGLQFRTASAARSLYALTLASAAPVRAALVAACWSAAVPPVSFPMNLPTALLLSGTPLVVGGLWPLPALSTAQVVSRTIIGLGEHGQLLPALAKARDAVEPTVLDRWGLAAHGSGPPPLPRV